MNITRKILEAAVLIGLGIVTFAGGGCGKEESGETGEPDKTRPAAASTKADDAQDFGDIEQAPPVVPNVALQVDFRSALTVEQGTPLIFTVRLANQQASNVLSLNAAGDDTRPAEAIPVLKLAPRWPRSVQFHLQGDDGGSAPLDWPLSSVGEQPAESTALDGLTNPQASWGLSPESAAKIVPGVYRVVAALQGREGDAFWAGRSVSAPVTITIEARQGDPKSPLAVESGLACAGYWAQVKDWQKSLAAARKVVQDDPNSIDGHTMLGDALAETNDAKGAVAAYGQAVRLFRQKYNPPGGEVPEYLLDQIRRLTPESSPKAQTRAGNNQ